MSGIDYLVRADYECIRAGYPDANLPEWDDLPEEKREFLRQEFRRHQADFDEIAKMARGEKPIP